MKQRTVGALVISGILLFLAIFFYQGADPTAHATAMSFNATLFLTEATCVDGYQNLNETGVDCGGNCNATCPTCDDNITNQGETAMDCGGPCAACPTCDDRTQNQGETGIDCGGPCTPCATAAARAGGGGGSSSSYNDILPIPILVPEIIAFTLPGGEQGATTSITLPDNQETQNDIVRSIDITLASSIADIPTSIEYIPRANYKILEPLGVPIYTYINVEHPTLPNNAISESILEFQITRQWLEKFKLLPSQIAFYRYDTTWNEYQTTIVDDSSDILTYTVTLPGLSLWAVGKSQKTTAAYAPAPVVKNETPVVIPTREKPAVPKPSIWSLPLRLFPSIYPWDYSREVLLGIILVMLILITIAAHLYHARLDKREQERFNKRIQVLSSRTKSHTKKKR